MKKFLWPLGIFTTALFIFVIYGFFKSDDQKAVENKEEIIQENSVSDKKMNTEDNKKTKINKSNIFIVSEYQGNIAIFEKNNSIPIKITDVQLIDLPETDRQLLKKGIEVTSKEELTNILEDYCS